MKVSDLIEKLSKLDQDAEIMIADADTGWLLPIEFVGNDLDAPVVALPTYYVAEGRIILCGTYN